MIQLSREVMWKGRRKNHCTKLQETPFDLWRFVLPPLSYAIRWTGDVLQEIINASCLWARCPREGAECYRGMTHRVRYPTCLSQLGQPCRSPRVVQLCPPSPTEIIHGHANGKDLRLFCLSVNLCQIPAQSLECRQTLTFNPAGLLCFKLVFKCFVEVGLEEQNNKFSYKI